MSSKDSFQLTVLGEKKTQQTKNKSFGLGLPNDVMCSLSTWQKDFSGPSQAPWVKTILTGFKT